MNTENQQSLPADVEFFLQINKEMGAETPHKAVSLVTSVLHAFRQTLSVKTAGELLNKMPDMLKLVFTSNWKAREKQVKVEHLDELVVLVMEQDKAAKKHLFTSEVQALSVIILTLKKLGKLVDLSSFDGLSASIRRELNEVSLDNTAAA